MAPRSKTYSLLAPRDITKTLTETGKARLASRIRDKAGERLEDRLLRIVETGSDADAMNAAKILLSYGYGKPTEFTVSAKVETSNDMPIARTLSTRELEEVANATAEDLGHGETDAEIVEPADIADPTI